MSPLNATRVQKKVLRKCDDKKFIVRSFEKHKNNFSNCLKAVVNLQGLHEIAFDHEVRCDACLIGEPNTCNAIRCLNNKGKFIVDLQAATDDVCCTKFKDCAADEYISNLSDTPDDGSAVEDRQCAKYRTSCPDGHTYDPTDKPVGQDRSCAACGAGTFKSSETECSPKKTRCANGEEIVQTDNTKDHECRMCDSGKFSLDGVTCVDRKTVCNIGFRLVVNTDSETDNECESCGTGTFSDDGLTCKDKTTTCAVGEQPVVTDNTQDNTCGVCPDGTFSADGAACLPRTMTCGPGKYLKKSSNVTTDGRSCNSWIWFNSIHGDADGQNYDGATTDNNCRFFPGYKGSSHIAYVSNPESYDGIYSSFKWNKGVHYRGTQNTTKSGKDCQKWTETSPQDPSSAIQTILSSNDKQGLGDHNYCRNPDDSDTLWCYTTDPNTRWEKCEPKPWSSSGWLCTNPDYDVVAAQQNNHAGNQYTSPGGQVVAHSKYAECDMDAGKHADNVCEDCPAGTYKEGTDGLTECKPFKTSADCQTESYLVDTSASLAKTGDKECKAYKTSCPTNQYLTGGSLNSDKVCKDKKIGGLLCKNADECLTGKCTNNFCNCQPGHFCPRAAYKKRMQDNTYAKYTKDAKEYNVLSSKTTEQPFEFALVNNDGTSCLHRPDQTKEELCAKITNTSADKTKCLDNIEPFNDFGKNGVYTLSDVNHFKLSRNECYDLAVVLEPSMGLSTFRKTLDPTNADYETNFSPNDKRAAEVYTTPSDKYNADFRLVQDDLPCGCSVDLGDENKIVFNMGLEVTTGGKTSVLCQKGNQGTKTQICRKKENVQNHNYFVIDYTKYYSHAPTCDDLGGEPVTSETECLSEINKHLLGCTGGVDRMPYKDFSGKNGSYFKDKPFVDMEDCANFATENGKNIFRKEVETWGDKKELCVLIDDHPGAGIYNNYETTCGYLPHGDQRCKTHSKDYSDHDTYSYYWGNNCRLRHADNVCTLKMQSSGFYGGSDSSWRQNPEHTELGKFRAELCKIKTVVASSS